VLGWARAAAALQCLARLGAAAAISRTAQCAVLPAPPVKKSSASHAPRHNLCLDASQHDILGLHTMSPPLGRLSTTLCTRAAPSDSHGPCLAELWAHSLLSFSLGFPPSRAHEHMPGVGAHPDTCTFTGGCFSQLEHRAREAWAHRAASLRRRLVQC